MSDHIEINVTEDERKIKNIILRSRKPISIQHIADEMKKPYGHVEMIVKMIDKGFGGIFIWGSTDDGSTVIQLVPHAHSARFRGPKEQN
jgi:hypothetical protein